MTKFTNILAIAFAILAVTATPCNIFLFSSLTVTTAAAVTTAKSNARCFEDFPPRDAVVTVVVPEECDGTLHECPAGGICLGTMLAHCPSPFHEESPDWQSCILKASAKEYVETILDYMKKRAVAVLCSLPGEKKDPAFWGGIKPNETYRGRPLFNTNRVAGAAGVDLSKLGTSLPTATAKHDGDPSAHRERRSSWWVWHSDLFYSANDDPSGPFFDIVDGGRWVTFHEDIPFDLPLTCRFLKKWRVYRSACSLSWDDALIFLLVAIYSLKYFVALIVSFLTFGITEEFIVQGIIAQLAHGVAALVSIAVILHALIGLTCSISKSILCIVVTFFRTPFNNGALPLHVACRFKAPTWVIRFMVRIGGIGTVEALDLNGCSPLHVACRFNAPIGVIDYLVEKGGHSTLFIQDNTGALPLHVACRFNASIGVIRILRPTEGGTRSTLFHLDHNGASPLHLACRYKASIEVIRLLMVCQSNTAFGMLQFRGPAGSLPVHEACRGGASAQVIALLVKHGGVAALRTRNQRGELPLHVLCGSNPSLESVQYLVQLFPGALFTKTSSGALPVFLACEASASIDVINFLLREYPDAVDL